MKSPFYRQKLFIFIFFIGCQQFFTSHPRMGQNLVHRWSVFWRILKHSYYEILKLITKKALRFILRMFSPEILLMSTFDFTLISASNCPGKNLSKVWILYSITKNNNMSIKNKNMSLNIIIIK